VIKWSRGFYVKTWKEMRNYLEAAEVITLTTTIRPLIIYYPKFGAKSFPN
jgi:hypothetical protein